MKTAGQILRRLLLVAACGYTLQVLIVIWWHVVPIARHASHGKTYTMTHGFGGCRDLIPILGLFPLTGEPVVLTIKDQVTRKETVYGFDLEEDVYSTFPEIAPASQINHDPNKPSTATP
jgi:hypothetical protein